MAAERPLEPQERQLTAQAARIEQLLAEIETHPDAIVRQKVTEIVQGMLALYGAGLAKIVEIARAESAPVPGEGSSPAGILAALAGDDLVAHLLLLHGLHPVALESRVARALEEVRPDLQTRGADVALVAIRNGTASVRIQRGCGSCAASARDLCLAVEEAVLRAAPDLARIEAEVTEPESGFVPASALLAPAGERIHG